MTDAPRLHVLTRRDCLALGLAATGIGVGLRLDAAAADRATPAAAPLPVPAAATAAPATPVSVPLSAYLFVGREDRVHLVLPVTEMGQGVVTTFAAQVAAELGFEQPTDVRVDAAPVGTAYMPPGARLQSTAGSTSVRHWHLVIGGAARQLRALLVAAAARRLGVAAEAVVLRPDHAAVGATPQRRVALGELQWPDASIPVVPTFGRLGQDEGRTTPASNYYAADIVGGTLEFGIDVRRPNQVHAAVRCNPAAGRGLRRYDAAAIRARRGVLDVVPLRNGLAVLAESWWQAQRALQDAAIEWEPGSGDSATLEAGLVARLAAGEVFEAPKTIAPAAALAAAKTRVSRQYFVPMLAHAALEPLACTAEFIDGRCHLWLGTQSPQLVARDVARALDIAYDAIDVHNLPMGGSFGRRVIGNEVAEQAALLARHAGRAVKLVWDREEDLRHDRYRPAMHARLDATLDAARRPVGFTARICGADWLEETGNGTPPVKARVNTLGLASPPYAFPGVDAGFVEAASVLPVGPWRSIAHGFNVFFLETFVDELAALAGADPLDYRASLLAADSPGHAVLGVVRERSGWEARRDGDAAAGARTAGWGVSLQHGWDTWLATVARVERRGAELRVTDVWAVLDCGFAVNPPGVLKQIEGGLMFGIDAALYGRVDYADGAATARNFADYRPLRFDEAPRLDVLRLDSPRRLICGIGEAGTSAVMPAVANAASALRGERLRRLPLVGP